MLGITSIKIKARHRDVYNEGKSEQVKVEVRCAVKSRGPASIRRPANSHGSACARGGEDQSPETRAVTCRLLVSLSDILHRGAIDRTLCTKRGQWRSAVPRSRTERSHRR